MNNNKIEKERFGENAIPFWLQLHDIALVSVAKYKEDLTQNDGAVQTLTFGEAGDRTGGRVKSFRVVGHSCFTLHPA